MLKIEFESNGDVGSEFEKTVDATRDFIANVLEPRTQQLMKDGQSGETELFASILTFLCMETAIAQGSEFAQHFKAAAKSMTRTVTEDANND